MFTARAARITIVASDMDACTIIKTLAQRESAGTSVGEKGGAGVECQKQIVNETRSPLVLPHFPPKICVQDHLRKQEYALRVGAARGSLMWSSRVESPVPAREDQ
jgi:hypothetical protein